MRLLVVHVPEAGPVYGVGGHRVQKIGDEIEGARVAHGGGQFDVFPPVIEHPRGLRALVVGEVEQADDAHSKPHISTMHFWQKRTLQPSALDRISGTSSSGMTAEQ